MAALAGERTARDDRALAAHLQSCAACQVETERLATLWMELGTLPERQPGAASQMRFDQMLAAWQNEARDGAAGSGARGADTPDAGASRAALQPRSGRSWGRRIRDWDGRIRDGVGTLAPARPAGQWAGAVALLACGFIAGSWVALRGGEMRALRQELQSTRSMMTLSLLQQRSPADRLQGIGYSMHDGAPDPQVVAALFETLDHDPNVDVRLAAADAIAGLHPAADVGARIVNSLRGQTSPLVQVALLDVIAKRHEADAQPLLLEMSANRRLNKSVRERADWALRQLTL